jgi:hypothetical protein
MHWGPSTLSGRGCYHASYAPIGLAYVEPCWRQHYPRLVLGFALINASTADSSQLAASDADGVRPDSGRSGPVRSSGGSRGAPQPARTPLFELLAVRSVRNSQRRAIAGDSDYWPVFKNGNPLTLAGPAHLRRLAGRAPLELAA